MTGNLVQGHTRSVLWLITEGLTNKEIARELQLAEPTVKWHVSKLLALYRVPNRAALVRAAMESGEVSQVDPESRLGVR